MELLEFKKFLLKIIEDKKGFEPEIIDVTHLTSIADSFIIAEGNSARHIKAMADEIIRASKKKNYPPVSFEGLADESGWALIDFGNVIVHLMTEEKRKKFKIEDFWKNELLKIKK